MRNIPWNKEETLALLSKEGKDEYQLRDDPTKAFKMVFKNNMEVFAQWGYVAPSGKEVKLPDRQRMLDATKVYRDVFSVNDIPAKGEDTVIEITETGSLELCRDMKQRGLNPAVLNFASAIRACGMYNEGSKAQEESLCRMSTLSQTLYQYYNKLWANKAGVPLRPEPAYPLHICFGGIYSKVSVFRKGPSEGFEFLEEPWETGIVSVAALKLSASREKSKEFDNREYADDNAPDRLTQEGREVTRDKIRTIYRIALSNGHDSIVLGAWGCGVFKNRPASIVRFFIDVLDEPEFRNKFKEVNFGVMGKENYITMARAIKGNDYFDYPDRPHFFSFRLGCENIWGCEYPFDLNEEIGRQKLDYALRFGITHFIDLTEEGEMKPYSQLLPEDVQHLRFPVKDQRVPKDTEELKVLVSRIREILSNPKAKVYLHCWGGVGRTGTVLACYMAQTRGTDYDETMRLLQSYWKHCPKSGWRVIPENKWQEKFIQKFIDSL